MTWRLRRASAHDLAHIMAIETSTFANDAWSEPQMLSELESDHTYYLVAYPDGDPGDLQGYAGIMALAGASEADIQTIAVVPEARRSGLGRLLMRSLLGYAREARCREVFLEVRADNPGARQLYADLGFIEIAVRPGYYQPDDIDAIVMKHVIVPAEPSLA